MWMLIISLSVLEPMAQPQSQGVITLAQNSYEECQKTRDQVQQSLRIDKHRTSVRCIWLKN